MNSYIKQKGLFSVEFVMVLSVIVLFLFFTAQVGVNLSIKGQMDRISYSVASLLRERLQFYKDATDNIKPLDQSQLEEIRLATSVVLTNSIPSYQDSSLEIAIEEYDPNDNSYNIYASNSSVCMPDIALNVKNTGYLSPVLSNSKHSKLYQSTVCYKSNAFFYDFSGVSNTSYTKSSSVTLGRYEYYTGD